MTGSGVDRKPKVYLLYLGWGRVRCSSQGHQRAPQKLGWVQKAKQGCERGFQAGKEQSVWCVHECSGNDPAPLPPKRGTDGTADVG